MKRILLLYASMTGNTEEVANILSGILEEKAFDVTRKSFDAGDVDSEELMEYDGILFGTYTYDDGDLPWEIEDFHENLLDVDLAGKKVALFGSGDSFYPDFCGAIDTMAARFREVGAEVVGEPVRVDLDPEEQDAENCRELVDALSLALHPGEHAVS